MAVRFRKSITLAPGIRMNISKSGISYSFGARGASITTGKRGTYVNAGIPGTGLYTRQRVDGASSPSYSQPSQTKTEINVTVGVKDDGTIYFLDESGTPLSDRLITSVKRKHGDTIKNLIQKKCDEINAGIESLGEIHLYTPPPDIKPTFEPAEFEEPQPRQPLPKKLGFFWSLFKFKRDQNENENRIAQEKYQSELNVWQNLKSAFDHEQLKRKLFIEEEIYTDNKAKEEYLAECLRSIVWPQETTVSFELKDDGKSVHIDVDLPEIEDMPTKTAAMPQRVYKLSVKDFSPTQVQKLYMAHIHGIGFRIIGEVFSSIQGADEVVLSAYSQRPDNRTGNISDEYLYSARVARKDWSKINFRNLKSLDIVEALNQFELRRDMSKTGAFKKIEPFG